MRRKLLRGLNDILLCIKVSILKIKHHKVIQKFTYTCPILLIHYKVYIRIQYTSFHICYIEKS